MAGDSGFDGSSGTGNGRGIKGLLDKTGIKRVYGNGAKACQLYDRFIKESTGVDIIKLPSTSPANAAWNLDRLIKEWSEKINF